MQPKIIKIFSAVMLIISSVAAAAFSVPAGQSSGFILTQHERAYLNSIQNTTIIIAYSYDLEHSVYGGILHPIRDVWENEFGLTVEFVQKSWQDALESIDSLEVDFYGPIIINEARRQRYHTVEPFHQSHQKIVTRRNNPLHTMMGLYNKNIGLLEGSAIADTMRPYLGSEGSQSRYRTMDDMMQALSLGAIDAFTTVSHIEIEIFRYGDIQIELVVDNSAVHQGLISNNPDYLQLANIFNRYIRENPQLIQQTNDARFDTLIRNTQVRLANEIAHISNIYDEIIMFSPSYFYPLSYMQNREMRGMMTEINDVFEQLTGVRVNIVTERDYPNGAQTALGNLVSGQCKVMVGGYYANYITVNSLIEYSPVIWLDTLRTYSHRRAPASLRGLTIGASILVGDYVGLNNTTGNEPVFFNSQTDMMRALRNKVIDVAVVSEMGFNYGISVQNDFSLREVMNDAILTQAPLYLLYGAQNPEFNAVFNESITLYHLLNPNALSMWKSYSDTYKNDFIRARYTQQNWAVAIICVFIAMFAALIYLLKRVRLSLSDSTSRNAELEEAQDIINAGINYSKKIQSSLLPKQRAFQTAFSDYSIVWDPRDVVGGDIYWLKQFRAGTVLCVCDCTGHGTPGALLTALVISAFEDMITEENCYNTAQVMWNLEKRLSGMFDVKASSSNEAFSIENIHDGCDLAVLYIANDKTVTISSSNTHVFICDGEGVNFIKGQKLYIGEGKIKNRESIKTITITPNPANKFYIASDGLFEQPGGEHERPYGYKEFKWLILENHAKTQQEISEIIMNAFNNYRGEFQRVDDMQLISFKP